MKNILAVIFLVTVTASLTAQNNNKTFNLAGYEVTMNGDFGDFDTQIKIDKVTEGLEIATISLSHEKGETPPEFTL